MTGAVYDNDWEDPHFSVEGFITDYIVWRLAREELEWSDALEVPRIDEKYRLAMRAICAEQEKLRQNNFPPHFNYFPTDLAVFRKAAKGMDQHFGRTMPYERLVEMISSAGVMSLAKALSGAPEEITEIARFTSTFIQRRIHLSWARDGLNWNLFVDHVDNVLPHHNRLSRQYNNYFAKYDTPSPVIALSTIASAAHTVILAAQFAVIAKMLFLKPLY